MLVFFSLLQVGILPTLGAAHTRQMLLSPVLMDAKPGGMMHL